MNISIIIPTFNEEKLINATIQAIKKRASGQENIEIIIVDGGSTDRTVARAQCRGVRVVYAPVAQRSIQMNNGARSAENDVFYFLHADTRPPPNFDRIIIETLKTGYQAGCFQLTFDSNHPLLQFYSWCTRFNIDTFRFGDQSLFVERKAFEQLDGFRGDHILLEGQNMVRRLKKNYSFKVCVQKVVTSARKYKSNGVLRLQCIYGLIYLLYRAGLSQVNLCSIYRKLVR